MTYRGRVQDGKIVLPDNVSLPEGAEVEVAITNALPQAKSLPEAEPKAKSIEEQISVIWSDMPSDAWARLPEDLTDQLDHYIYGTPRK